jgi:hypothetical protein
MTGPLTFVASQLERLLCWQVVALALLVWLFQNTLRALLVPLPKRAPRAVPKKARGSGQTIPMTSPATGENLGESRAYTPNEVKAAYEAAEVRGGCSSSGAELS